ncbi:MAG: response regulator [Candidatus Jordarchaeaceae archaeon]
MSKRILFVDDSPTMRRIIRNTLEKIGYEDLIEAENGSDALQKLSGQKVDLIITDWNMPEMNGEEFIRALKSEEEYKNIPIIMVTTRGMKDDVMTALALGVNSYVVKPFTPDVIKKKIMELLG